MCMHFTQDTQKFGNAEIHTDDSQLNNSQRWHQLSKVSSHWASYVYADMMRSHNFVHVSQCYTDHNTSSA